jgi:hypothetical protein
MPRRVGNRFDNLNGVPLVAGPPVLPFAYALVGEPPVAPATSREYLNNEFNNYSPSER